MATYSFVQMQQKKVLQEKISISMNDLSKNGSRPHFPQLIFDYEIY